MSFRLEDHFVGRLDPLWEVAEAGRASVKPTPDGLRMSIQHAHGAYSNAQIADYSYRDFHFRWRPPVRMTVVARSEGDLPNGTAGFGFWNHPFSPDSHRLPRLPQAIWFFYAGAQSNMALAYGVPGCGWKAATLDAARPAAVALTPLALPAALLMRSQALYARLYPAIQRQLHISERLLDPALLAERHAYALEWRRDGATFTVDGATVCETPYAPRGPAGFVTWIDNRYAVVTPQGRLRFGIAPVEGVQALILEQIVIEGETE